MSDQRDPFVEAVARGDFHEAHVLMIERLLGRVEETSGVRDTAELCREIRLWVASAQKLDDPEPVAAEPTLGEMFEAAGEPSLGKGRLGVAR